MVNLQNVFAASVHLGLLAVRGIADDSVPPPDIAGVWHDTIKSDHYIEFGDGRINEIWHEEPYFARATFGDGSANRKAYGAAASARWTLKHDGDHLLVHVESKKGESSTDGKTTFVDAVDDYVLERSKVTPASLDPKPYALLKARELDAARIQTLQAEIKTRRDKDQEIRQSKNPKHEDFVVDEDNTKWLVKTILEVGWIDVDRFGKEASNSAFLLVQHSPDLRLMLTALPFIETDVKAKKLDAQPYSLLYDRLQLRLGYRQRYGTQIGENTKGQFVVSALEDRKNVEQLRKDLGLFPLAQYFDMIRKAYGEKEIVFEDDEP